VSEDSAETFASLLARRPLTVPEALAVLRDLAEALEPLHARGKAHGAVSPENIVIGPDGLARLTPPTGPPTHRSPEELQGQLPDPPSDVYALGATIAAAIAPTHAIPEPLERLLATMTAPDPRARPQSAGEVLLGLDACVLLCSCRPIRPGQESAARRARQSLLPLVILLLGLIVFGAAALVVLGPTPAPRGEPPQSFKSVIERATTASQGHK